MLVLDCSQGHLVDMKKELLEGKIDLVIISGRLTSILQLLELSVNKSFTDNIGQLCGDWNKQKTPTEKVKYPSL